MGPITHQRPAVGVYLRRKGEGALSNAAARQREWNDVAGAIKERYRTGMGLRWIKACVGAWLGSSVNLRTPESLRARDGAIGAALPRMA